MEQTVGADAAGLLDGVTDINKRYEARWQKTGEKYNIFKVAGIAHKEVVMCRVLADLMNPRGKHGQGSRYLKSFWETIASKLPGRLALDIEHTRVTTEYVIDENRRIDITLEDGKIFVPIEVKIWAGDQPKQIADYFDFAGTKNRNSHIPVLYLTVDGHEPPDFSRAGLGKDGCVTISFKDDILVWLLACARNTPETMIPIRENIRQLIAAVKSLCGKSEDAEMEDEIFKLVTKDDDSVRAALAIRGAVDFDGRALDAFKERIVPLVKKFFPGAEYTADDGWYMLQVPVDGGNYLLDVNYDWKSFHVEVCVGEKERNRQLEERMAKEMAARTNHQTENAGGGIFALWGTNRYPGLETVDEALYFYRLCKEYIERPQETADRIISIAKALESVKA